MRTDPDHLPALQQRELERVTQTLLAEFDAAVAGGTQPFRKQGKVLKIILFGSYARNDWVDEPDNGYQSDYDLLVIVSHEKLDAPTGPAARPSPWLVSSWVVRCSRP